MFCFLLFGSEQLKLINGLMIFFEVIRRERSSHLLHLKYLGKYPGEQQPIPGIKL
jgi:hypothetical protein